MDTRSFIIAATSATAAAIVGYQLIISDSYFRRQLKNYLHPYVKVGIVTDLFVYPLKSGLAKMVHEYRNGK